MFTTALYLQEQHDVECGGRHIQYFIATFLTKPYPIEPTLGDLHDYRKCKGCQDTNKEIVRQLKVKFDKFPFCCQWHQKLLSINEFNKLDFAFFLQMTVLINWARRIHHKGQPTKLSIVISTFLIIKTELTGNKILLIIWNIQ